MTPCPLFRGKQKGTEAVLRRGAGPRTGQGDSVNGDAPPLPEGTSLGRGSAVAISGPCQPRDISPCSVLVMPVSEQLAPGPLAPLGERQWTGVGG